MQEKITIRGEWARWSNGGTQYRAKVSDWLDEVRRDTIQGLFDDPIPGNVRWRVRCGSLEICVAEFMPQVRRILWQDEDGSPNARYRERGLAFPYVVLKAAFRQGRVVDRCEVFYRNEPLRSLHGEGGELYWPNLLNVSVECNECLAWFCTQYLWREGVTLGVAAGLNAVAHHLWDGGFNRSSEVHEGVSTYSKAVQEGVDPRVTDVDLWEACSAADPSFILSVDWRSTGLAVGDLVEAELRRLGRWPVKHNLAALANYLIGTSRGRRRRQCHET